MWHHIMRVLYSVILLSLPSSRFGRNVWIYNSEYRKPEIGAHISSTN